MLVGRLSSTDGQTSIMSLYDGGVLTVRGTGTVNAYYYMRGGQIQGLATTISPLDIAV